MRAPIIVVLLLGLAATPALADAPADMAATANGFYKVYQGVGRIGGMPNAVARAHYAAYLSPRLAGLLAQAAAAETRSTAKFKAVPPLFEGDIFTSLFEGATSWNVQGCSANGQAGTCQISLTHEAPSQKPVHWTDDLLMVQTPAGWKIDDVAYRAGFQSGNSGTLSETVKMVLAEAGQ